MQDDAKTLPADGLYVPAGQGMHDDAEVLPGDGLYVPGLHAMHEVTSLPVKLLNVPGAHAMQPKPFKFTTEPATQKGQRDVGALAENRSL
jgi:hypothetical protein